VRASHNFLTMATLRPEEGGGVSATKWLHIEVPADSYTSFDIIKIRERKLKGASIRLESTPRKWMTR